MCIGIPMQVVEAHEFHAVCADGERRRRVDTSLVGRPPMGSWLLVFLKSLAKTTSESPAEQEY
jgi:hydrogenase expression/formation protein HypC